MPHTCPARPPQGLQGIGIRIALEGRVGRRNAIDLVFCVPIDKWGFQCLNLCEHEVSDIVVPIPSLAFLGPAADLVDRRWNSQKVEAPALECSGSSTSAENTPLVPSTSVSMRASTGG
ncbi:hypothetical protein E2C01_004277 [Portunus trituberculatus]|uniref:Uncharacterized protein n=1 Tax=Portunus trituberculatus TaxID=210409 RepID=A0A5B7CTL2_PORTR|nr:hypothetical protein [Portunus trituberculatus]